MRWATVVLAALVVLLIATVGWALSGWLHPERAGLSLLAVQWFILSLAMGALSWLGIVHAAGALWAVPLRRLLEAAWPLWILVGLGAVGIALMAGTLFPWAGAHAPHERELAHVVAHQAAWFHPAAVALRWILIPLIGGVPAVLLARWSRRQDAGAHRPWAERMRRLGAACLPLLGLGLALALTAACLDWLFALAPHQHSTIIAVLVYAAGAQAVLAAWICATAWCSGRIRPGPGQWYALGTLLFAFSCFWAYCHLSQALIVYMGDLPVKAPWLLARRSDWWGLISLVLIVVRFVLPFVFLAMRPMRCAPRLLVPVSLVILAGHGLEVFWWVVPTAHGTHPWMAWSDAAALAGGLALIVLVVVPVLRRQGLVVQGDERLERAREHRPA
ncbi:MAG: hypothetical protein ACOCXJ_09015 [Planctomycetota bacterium]